MAHAAKIVAAAFGKDEPIRFERLEIEEPEKAVLRAWKPGAPWDRKVRFSIYPVGRSGVTEGILSLGEERVLSSRHLPTARPMIMLEEFLEVEKAVKASRNSSPAAGAAGSRTSKWYASILGQRGRMACRARRGMWSTSENRAVKEEKAGHQAMPSRNSWDRPSASEVKLSTYLIRFDQAAGASQAEQTRSQSASRRQYGVPWWPRASVSQRHRSSWRRNGKRQSQMDWPKDGL